MTDDFKPLSYEQVEDYGKQFGGKISSVLDSKITDPNNIPNDVQKKDEWISLCSSNDVTEPVFFLIMYVYPDSDPKKRNQLIILRRTFNNEGSILMRTSSNGQIRQVLDTGIKDLKDAENTGETYNGFYFKQKKSTTATIRGNELVLTNKDNLLSSNEVTHYIYIDKTSSECYVLAKYTSVIRATDFPTELDLDTYSPYGFRTIITEKNSVLSHSSLRKNLDYVKARKKETKGYPFAFTFKFTIDDHIIYVCFIEDWNDTNGTLVEIIYPIQNGEDIIEYGMTGYQDIKVTDLINGWDESNKLKFNEDPFVICPYLFSISYDRDHFTLKLFDAGNYDPLDNDETFNVDLCNISALPIPCAEELSDSMQKSIIFDGAIKENGYYPFAIFNGLFKIKSASSITPEQKETLLEYCDYNILTRNYCNCFTFFVGNDVRTVYPDLESNDLETVECIYNLVKDGSNYKSGGSIVYTLTSDNIIVNGKIQDSLASLQLFNGERIDNGNHVYAYTGDGTDIIVDYQSYVMYRPITYLYENCIDTGYHLTSADHNLMANSDAIYKLSFRKLDDGSSSDSSDSSDDEKCIYFTLSFKEKLTITCFNKIAPALKLYGSIKVDYSRNEDGNGIDCSEYGKYVGTLAIYSQKNRCSISKFSGLIELLIPCDGDYYYDDSTFKCEMIPKASFISIYSNYSNASGEKDVIDGNFDDIIKMDFSKSNFVCYQFRITISYSSYEYVVDLSYVVFPKKYENGVTVFKKGGYVKCGEFAIQAQDLIQLVTIRNNAIETIDFILYDLQYTNTNPFQTTEDCYEVMPNHNYNYPPLSDWEGATNITLAIKMTGISWN